jgi:hypothetical protein
MLSSCCYELRMRLSLHCRPLLFRTVDALRKDCGSALPIRAVSHATGPFGVPDWRQTCEADALHCTALYSTSVRPPLTDPMDAATAHRSAA